MGETTALQGFSPEVFADRRRKALDGLGAGAMVIPTAPILVRGRDSELRFRPGSEFFYLTGFSEPEAVLVLRGFAGDTREILFVRPRDEGAERWSGPRLGPEGARAVLEVGDVRAIEALEGAMPGLLEGADRIHYRLGADERLDRGVRQALGTARRRGARKGTGPRGIVDPGEILDELRIRKAPEEVDAVREASSITVSGFRAALAHLAPGLGEWELEAAIEGEFRRRGASGPAFPTIVGSGPNACVLHYVENSRRMGAGDLVLVDAGAEHRMYSGDVTRTVPVSGRFSPQQRDVYEIVDQARREAIATIGPGAPVEAGHDRAVRVLVEGLKSLGIRTGGVDELIENKALQPYFPHSTSHWLGLDTHDVGDYEREGSPRALAAGMILTVEPGLYFVPDGGTAFDGIGIRIEDDILVTEDGAEVLTQGLATRPGEVEALVEAARGP